MAEELGPEASESGTKPCPFCAENIRVAAIKCRFCGTMLAEEGATAEPMTEVRIRSEKATASGEALGWGSKVGCSMVVMAVLFTFGERCDDEGGSGVSPSFIGAGQVERQEDWVPTKDSVPVAGLESKPQIVVESQDVRVGQITYCALWSWWEVRFGGMIDERADESFLVVQVEVRNDGQAAISIPSIHVVDEQGRSYDRTYKDFFVKNRLGTTEKLNPRVSRVGQVAFDVPRGEGYKLKVASGYRSKDTAWISLSPKPKR